MKLHYVPAFRMNIQRRERVRALYAGIPDGSYLEPLLGIGEALNDGLPGYVLVYLDAELVGYAEVYRSTHGWAELRGAVAAKVRRQGIFTKMSVMLTDGRTEPVYYAGTAEQDAFCGTMKAWSMTRAETDFLMEHRWKQIAAEDSASVADLPEGIVLETNRAECACTVYACDGEYIVGEVHSFAGIQNVCIYDVFVAEEYRRRGVARAMLRKCMGSYANGTTFRLHVAESNIGAVKLYRGLGFQPVQEICYYRR